MANAYRILTHGRTLIQTLHPITYKANDNEPLYIVQMVVYLLCDRRANA